MSESTPEVVVLFDPQGREYATGSLVEQVQLRSQGYTTEPRPDQVAAQQAEHVDELPAADAVRLVQEHPEAAAVVLEAEKAGKGRSTVLKAAESVTASPVVPSD
jgi:hypothetical protein